MSKTGPASISTRLGWRDGGVCVLLAGLVICLFWPVRHFEFLRYDDARYLVENTRMHAGLTLATARWAVSSTFLSNYIPVAVLSSLADVSIWGLKPGPMHFENAILHAVSTAGWYLLWVMLTGRRGRSAMVAGVFGLHPMHVEPVAWIVERCDVLCMVFVVGSLLAYVGYARTGRGILLAVSMLIYPLALLSKAMAVVVPIVLLLINLWPLRRVALPKSLRWPATDATAALAVPWWRMMLELVPFGLLAVAASAGAVLARGTNHATLPLADWSVATRFATVVFGYSSYLAKLFWPEPMIVLYPLSRNYESSAVLAATVLLGIVTAAAVWVGRHRPYVLIGFLWFVGTLLPSIGIVQSGRQAMADRYTYLPYVGLSVAIVWWTADLSRRVLPGRIRTAVLNLIGSVTLLACSVEARHQLRYWADSFTLFSHALPYAPYDAVLTHAMGTEYKLQGRFDLAINYYGRSVAADPDNLLSQNDLGWLLLEYTGPAAALPHFQAVARLAPKLPDFLFGLGVCQKRLGDSVAAADTFGRILQINPHYEAARQELNTIDK